MIGSNDLRLGGCSEQATLLGILKTALILHNTFPHAQVVIQSILPQGWEHDKECLLEEPGQHSLGKRQDTEEEFPFLWPSIQRINDQLRAFCDSHYSFVFFDATDLFIERTTLEHQAEDIEPSYHSRIDRRLMPDCQHLSLEGWHMLGSAIHEEYVRIVFNKEFENQKAYREDWLHTAGLPKMSSPS